MIIDDLLMFLMFIDDQRFRPQAANVFSSIFDDDDDGDEDERDEGHEPTPSPARSTQIGGYTDNFYCICLYISKVR
jgi:hypothetical protein